MLLYTFKFEPCRRKFMRKMGPTVHEKDRRESLAAIEAKPAEGFGRYG